MMDYVILTAIDGFFAREVEKCPWGPGRAREGDG